MTRQVRGFAAAAASLLLLAAAPASAQKPGGVLKIQHFDSPASMSILEESTRAALQPMMAVFNNLVMYDQHVAQNSLNSIVPDLATGWNWGEDGKELTFPLHQGVKWHDGKPFTAADVKCTWDLLMGLSVEPDPEKRKQIVWQLERKLADAAVRPVLFFPVGATCRQPYVKGLTIMVNSIYNGWRMEDVWLDK